jgi:hypothetical protein
MKEFKNAADRFDACMRQAAGIVASYRAQAPVGFDPQNAETLVADLSIVPEVFLPYSVEQTAAKSELIQSGIIETNPDFARRADVGFDQPEQRGGQYTAMPFWQDLVGDDEVISDTGSLTTAKITSAADLAVIHNRAKAWSDNDMVGIIGGSDPATAVGQLSGKYWERRLQSLTLSTLKGVFAHASMASNSADIYLASGSSFTVANYLTPATFIAGKQLMGDAKENLTAIIMHSAVEAALELQNLIVYIPGTEQGTLVKTFGGKRVIIDDTMTVEVLNSANVYSTFLFGVGALAYGVGTMNKPIRGATDGSTWGLEWDRVALAGQNIMIQRRRFILHPRGVKFKGVIAGLSPTNAELELSTSWERVFEAKNVRMVRIRHNIPA